MTSDRGSEGEVHSLYPRSYLCTQVHCCCEKQVLTVSAKAILSLFQIPIPPADDFIYFLTSICPTPMNEDIVCSLRLFCHKPFIYDIALTDLLF